MDHVSARDARRQGAHSRRWRMREQARSQHSAVSAAPASARYQTPEWLERSFVLPLTQPEASDVPSQPVRRHDDDPDPGPEARVTPPVAASSSMPAAPTPESPPAGFVRPPINHVDFARVIRRSELCRKVTWLHWVATGLAGLALLAFLLTSSAIALGVVVAFAAVAVVAFGVRVRLSRAPVPHVRR
jgi:hypothetical protein